MPRRSGAASFVCACRFNSLARILAARPVVAAVMAAAMLSMPACGGSGPTDPDPPDASGIAGTWVGDASDSSGPGRMTWEIQNDVSPFAGVLRVTDLHSGYSGKGSVSGSTSGTVLQFTLKIPVQGFDPPFDNCTSEMTGEGQLSAATITGTYSGTNPCWGAISAGQFTLTRQ